MLNGDKYEAMTFKATIQIPNFETEDTIGKMNVFTEKIYHASVPYVLQVRWETSN